MSKRQKFIAITLVLVLALIYLLRQPLAYSASWWFAVPLLSLILSWAALRQELSGIEYFTALFLPFTYTLVFSLIFRVFTFAPVFRFAMLGMYGFGFYIILLCENILSISSFKIIPLHRAARTVSLLLTFFTSFLAFTVLYKFRLPVWLQILVVFIYALPACWQYLWTIGFEKVLTSSVKWSGLLTAFVTMEVAFALSFLPLRVFIRALLVDVPIYFGLGLLTQYFQKRLHPRHITEYALVVLAAVVLMLLVL